MFVCEFDKLLSWAVWDNLAGHQLALGVLHLLAVLLLLHLEDNVNKEDNVNLEDNVNKEDKETGICLSRSMGNKVESSFFSNKKNFTSSMFSP